MPRDGHDFSRRDFLRLGGSALVSARSTWALAAPGQTGRAGQPPNIVVILADDLGFSDIGCYGSEIETPNLDGLARGGVRLTRFYNAARCCPTRAALLTGLYPHQAGVGAMVTDFGHPAYRGRLNDACVTIAEALRPASYRTYMSGKWHVGEERPHWPTDRGFDRYFGLISGATSYFHLDAGRKMARDDAPFTPGPGFYMTDAIGESAVAFVREHAERHADRPFFLYVAFTAPHWPLHALPETIRKYRGRYRMGWDEVRARRHRRQLEMGLVSERWPLTPRDAVVPAWDLERNRDESAHRMAVYAAQVDDMDRAVGRILSALRSVGAFENTLILFLADNGGCAEVVDRGTKGVPAGEPDSFLSYGVGWANASNTPFRRYKQWVHEGGIASPLIAHWPGVVAKANGVTDQVGHVVDIMATCLDAGRAEYPEQVGGRRITPLEGRSLLPILRGETRAPHEALFWEHFGSKAVREGRFKLVAPRETGRFELYDIEADRTELRDLAGNEPDRVRALTERWDAWAKACGVLPHPVEKIMAPGPVSR